MKKNSQNISKASEELLRMRLLMGYSSKNTLSENIESIIKTNLRDYISEQGFGGTAGIVGSGNYNQDENPFRVKIPTDDEMKKKEEIKKNKELLSKPSQSNTGQGQTSPETSTGEVTKTEEQPQNQLSFEPYIPPSESTGLAPIDPMKARSWDDLKKDAKFKAESSFQWLKSNSLDPSLKYKIDLGPFSIPETSKLEEKIQVEGPFVMEQDETIEKIGVTYKDNIITTPLHGKVNTFFTFKNLSKSAITINRVWTNQYSVSYGDGNTEEERIGISYSDKTFQPNNTSKIYLTINSDLSWASLFKSIGMDNIREFQKRWKEKHSWGGGIDYSSDIMFDKIPEQTIKSLQTYQKVMEEEKKPLLFIETNIGTLVVPMKIDYPEYVKQYIEYLERAQNRRSVKNNIPVPEGFTPFTYDEFLDNLDRLINEFGCKSLVDEKKKYRYGQGFTERNFESLGKVESYKRLSFMNILSEQDPMDRRIGIDDKSRKQKEKESEEKRQLKNFIPKNSDPDLIGKRIKDYVQIKGSNTQICREAFDVLYNQYHSDEFRFGITKEDEKIFRRDQLSKKDEIIDFIYSRAYAFPNGDGIPWDELERGGIAKSKEEIINKINELNSKNSVIVKLKEGDQYYDPNIPNQYMTVEITEDKKVLGTQTGEELWRMLKDLDNLQGKYGLDTRSGFDKFMDSEWGQWAQMGVSVILLAAGFFTGGSTWAGLILNGIDVVINLGIAAYQLKRGNTRDALISALFACIPILHKAYSKIATKLSKVLGLTEVPTKETLKKLGKSILAKTVNFDLNSVEGINSALIVLNKEEQAYLRTIVDTPVSELKEHIIEMGEKYMELNKIAQARPWETAEKLGAVGKFATKMAVDMTVTIPALEAAYDKFKQIMSKKGINITWRERDHKFEYDWMQENLVPQQMELLFDNIGKVTEKLKKEEIEYYNNQILKRIDEIAKNAKSFDDISFLLTNNTDEAILKEVQRIKKETQKLESEKRSYEEFKSKQTPESLQQINMEAEKNIENEMIKWLNSQTQNTTNINNTIPK